MHPCVCVYVCVCVQPMREFLSQCLAPKPEARPTFTEIIPMLEELEQELC